MLAKFCHLAPVGPGKYYLRPIDLYLGNQKIIILGRNAETGLDQDSVDQFSGDSDVMANVVFLSRSHIEVKVGDGKVWVKPIARQPKWVYKNGVALTDGVFEQIHIGDSITMLGRLSYFTYILFDGKSNKVNESQPYKKSRPNEELEPVLPCSSALSVNAGARIGVVTTSRDSAQVQSCLPPEPPPAVSTSVLISSVLENNEMNDHVECSICLNTLAFPHNVVPCGDTFCYACIADWAKKKQTCPHCQQIFDPKLITHNRVLDNMIGGMLRLRGGEVLNEWEKREEDGKEQKKNGSIPIQTRTLFHLPRTMAPVAALPTSTISSRASASLPRPLVPVAQAFAPLVPVPAVVGQNLQLPRPSVPAAPTRPQHNSIAAPRFESIPPGPVPVPSQSRVSYSRHDPVVLSNSPPRQSGIQPQPAVSLIPGTRPVTRSPKKRTASSSFVDLT